jgi:hypothetical protein
MKTRWYAGLGRRFLLGYKHGAVGTLCEVDCSDAINLVLGRVKNPGRTTKDTAVSRLFINQVTEKATGGICRRREQPFGFRHAVPVISTR